MQSLDQPAEYRIGEINAVCINASIREPLNLFNYLKQSFPSLLKKKHPILLSTVIMRVFKALRAAAAVNVTNVQGDVFSRGFPKHYEIYYFFSINEGKNFPKAVGTLMSKKHISNLKQVIDDWGVIDKDKEEAEKTRTKAPLREMAHALIGFSSSGLKKLSPLIGIPVAMLIRPRVDCL
jgi:hypothetical protein